MTQFEWRIVKILLVLVILAASVPAGALVYKYLAPESGGSESLTGLFQPAESTATRTTGPVTPAPPSIVDVSNAGGRYVEYAVSDQGFAISIPESWQRLPMNPADLQALLASTRAANPELANMLGSNAQTLIQNGIRFWAYDADPAALRSNIATTVTVLKRTLPGPVSLETYVQLNVNQITEMKTRVGAVNSQRLSLNGKAAQQLQYTISFAQSNGTSVLTSVTQFFMVDNADAYVIGFAAAPGSAESYLPVFLKTAASFRLLQ